jgi:hypothetical protein
MKLFKNYLKEEFIEDDFLLFLNIVFMILVIPFLLILLRKYKMLNNYKGIIVIIIVSFIFTYISFEINCKIINLIKKFKRK